MTCIICIYIYQIYYLIGCFRRMNIPDWLNINQMIGLLVFCCIVLSGMHLELERVSHNLLILLI